jgi:hypothetical protein
MKPVILYFLLSGLLCSASLVWADDNEPALLATYRGQAEQPLSAERGKALWEKRNGSKSCTSCHGSDPAQPGEMEVMFFFSRSIPPMALSANPKRFQDAETADKKFDKNCKRVFQRVCTPQEKGDILFYLVRGTK